MFKKTLKKAAAVFCAAAVCAQLAVMPTVSAKYINDDQSAIIVERTGYDGLEYLTTETNNSDTTKGTKTIAIGGERSGDFTLEFDFKMVGNMPSGSGDRKVFNTGFLRPASKKVGPVFMPTSVTDSTYNAMWRVGSDNPANIVTGLNIGETYHMTWSFHNVLGGANAAKVDVKITDMNESELVNAADQSLRQISEDNVAVTGIEVSSVSADGTESGWVVSNVMYVSGMDAIDVTIDGKDPEAAEYTANKFDDTVYDVVSAAKLKGVTLSSKVDTTITSADGSDLPGGISFTDGKLMISKDTAAGTYDLLISAAMASNPDLNVEYSAKIIKPSYTDADYLKEMGKRLVLKKADGEEIADADKSNITTDLTLDKGDSKMSVTWEAGREVSVEVPVLDSNGKPTVDSNGKPVTKTEIQWQSDTSVINPSTGVITPDEEDKAVTLRATLAMKNEESDAQPVKKDFNITVKGVKNTVQSAVDAIKFISDDDSAKEVDFTKLSEDVKLQTTSSVSPYINIKWETNNTENLKIESNTAKVFLAKPGTASAKLTATVSYVKGGKTSSTITKEYPVTVSIDSTSGGKYTVRCDAAASENFAGVPSSGDSVTDDIDLPTKGIFGSEISWSSSSPSVISNIGKVTRQSSSKTITLTATIKKAPATQSMKFSGITVPAKNGSSSSSSGGSGSSGSEKKTYIAPNTATPAPIVNNNNNNQQNQTPNTNRGFTDLGSVTWAQPAINSMYARGILSGKTATEFAPNDNVTRAEFAKIVVKAFGLEDSGAAVSSFSDVNAGDWYYEYVAAAYNKGIITGYNDGRFGVSDNITRQDMAVIIYRAAQAAGKSIKDVNAEINFADAGSIAGYAKEAVTALQKGGVINGVSDTEFAPTNTATRAQAAKMVYGLI